MWFVTHLKLKFLLLTFIFLLVLVLLAQILLQNLVFCKGWTQGTSYRLDEVIYVKTKAWWVIMLISLNPANGRFAFPYTSMKTSNMFGLIYQTNVHLNSRCMLISMSAFISFDVSVWPNLMPRLTLCTQVWNQRGPALQRSEREKKEEFWDL